MIDVKINSRKYGEGEPIILIHGFCETMEVWKYLIDPLKNYGCIIAIDLPGFGESTLSKNNFTIDEVANLLVDWLDAESIQKPILIGHSLGGYVALAMAALKPERFNKLVLFHSSIYSDPPEKRENRDKVAEFVRKNGIAPFVDTFVPSLFYKKDNPLIPEVHTMCASTKAETLISYTLAMRDRPSREEFVKLIPLPLLIIAGDHDGIISIETSKKMANANKSIKLSILPNTGHLGMLEAPEKALKAIIDFI